MPCLASAQYWWSVPAQSWGTFAEVLVRRKSWTTLKVERNTADKDSSDNQDSNGNIGQIAKFAYIQLQQRRLIDGFCNGGQVLSCKISTVQQCIGASWWLFWGSHGSLGLAWVLDSSIQWRRSSVLIAFNPRRGPSLTHLFHFTSQIFAYNGTWSKYVYQSIFSQVNSFGFCFLFFM